ncbi:MAG: hypothetical protein CL943_00685 [Candidatus Diapherotrites archaeon]|uniref:Glycosyltransferase RgtA/B/C/D-like domain-containing protein n=1 Tax=Candidatus Iainarchaeum sp. TaxID=3101447 RepID=A0A2D6M057_9ARCH|nr:hypothetical protein [Candidatus Diapherotrites archaeon]
MGDYLNFKQYSKQELAVISSIVLFIFLFFSPVVSGDGFGYYALLESIGKDHTFPPNLENQIRFNAIASPGEPEATPNFVRFNEVTKKYVTHYAPGSALFSLPLYIVSLGLAEVPLLRIADDFFVNERGAPLVNQLGFTLTALLFVLGGLVLLVKFVREYFGKNASLAVLLAFFGTPLLWYASADIAYSHAFEVGLMTWFIYTILKSPSAKKEGIILGLLTITRYTAGIFALPMVLFYLFKKQYKNAAIFLGSFIPFVILMMLYFTVQFGSPFLAGFNTTAANNPAVFDSFLPVHIVEVLFDLSHGVLWWAPLVLVGIAGLWFFSNEKKWLLLSFVGLNFWVYSAWTAWHSGWSFGNRFVIILFPLIVLGIAQLLKQKPKLKVPLIVLSAYTLLLFVLFIASTPQLADPFNLQSLIAFWLADGRLLELPARLIGKISIVRAISLV